MKKSKKVELITFRDIRGYTLDSVKQDEPSCFNSDVRYKKYKITVEEIEEPVEIYHERLQKLMDDSKNHHDWEPLQRAAKEVGYEFRK